MTITMNLHSEVKQLKRDQWVQCLFDANGFDQVKSVIENWRAGESALHPDPKDTNVKMEIYL